MIKPKDIKTEFLHPEKRDAIQQPNNHLDNYTFAQDEFQELFNDDNLGIPPGWLMNHARFFYATPKGVPERDGWIVNEIALENDDEQQETIQGKILTDYCSDRVTFVISKKQLEENTNEPKLLAGVGKTELFIENLKIAIAEADAKKKLKPKTKKKANYKNKAYKNTAKQTKPSPILMSLIKKV